LPPYPADPLKVPLATSTNEQLLAVSSGRTRDLSTKRNLGLVIAKMLGWQRLMFLDDDIFGISREDVAALAAGLNNHNVSVLIPEEYPDNSVACHAYRLGGEDQGKFASAGGMGVRCDRDDLPFFPNIYNEDWFFFADEAANRRINTVGKSQQKVYNPYEDPERAVKEEFGDLLAEGLYARLDKRLDIGSVDRGYWAEFIEGRKLFLERVARLLAKKLNGEPNSDKRSEIRAAQNSIAAAQRQLTENITDELCQKFIDLWQADLIEWRSYLAGELPRCDSIPSALEYLGLDYA
jgi:glycosyltransferase involved in cell wall biosynthesis